MGKPSSDSYPKVTQRDRMLRVLLEARGREVPLPQIQAVAAQYNARLLELRRAGFRIKNRTEWRDGQRHSWFRLVLQPSQPAPATAEPKPAPSAPLLFPAQRSGGIADECSREELSRQRSRRSRRVPA